MKKPFSILAFCAVLCWFGSGLAQSYTIGSSFGFDGKIKPEFSVFNLNLEGLRFDTRLAGGVSDALELGFGVRYDQSFAPLGNLRFYGRFDLKSSGLFQLKLSAEGVIGGIAGSAAARVFSSSAKNFGLETAFGKEQVWLYPEGKVGLELSLNTRYRLDRSSILDASLDLIYLFDQGLAAELFTSYSLLKIVEKDDIIFKAKAYTSPGFIQSYAALGFTYDVNRPDWPINIVEIWLGAGTAGIWPGLKLELSESFSEVKASAGAYLSLEPYLIDSAGLKAEIFYEQALDYGSLRLSLGVMRQADDFVNQTSISYSFSFN